MTTLTFTKKETPAWLLAFWKEIDDKTFGEASTASSRMRHAGSGSPNGMGGRRSARSLRAFVDTGFTALHTVTEYWDSPTLKIFRGTVRMTPDDSSKQPVRPVMTHFFYMDEADPAKVRSWIGSVGPNPVLMGGTSRPRKPCVTPASALRRPRPSRPCPDRPRLAPRNPRQPPGDRRRSGSGSSSTCLPSDRPGSRSRRSP